MIPRSLVPPGVHLSDAPAESAPRRLTTLLDERTVVASNLPSNGLDTHSNIPADLSLDVLGSRTVVPRDTPTTPLDESVLHPKYEPVTVMDHRVTVPAAMPVVELQTKGLVAAYELPDVLEPDVLTTGEINLSVEPIEEPSRDWDWIARAGSVGAHFLLLLLLIFQSKIFPYRPPTAGDIDRARQQLIFIDPGLRAEARAPAPERISPNLRVDPREIRKVAPTMPQPMPGPKLTGPVVRDNPVAAPPAPPVIPAAKPPVVTPDNRPPDFLRAPTANAPALPQPAPQPQIQAQQAQPQQSSGGLILPKAVSPGRALDQDVQQALGAGGGRPSVQIGGGAGGGGQGGGGGSGPGAGALQMLTPTEGVDFTNYLQRVLASVKRNWFAIMPESVYLGEKGNVVLRFKITKNGIVPEGEPMLMSGSGKEPLDRAALSSIRASSPFEPLPPAFSGPYIELQFTFLYNAPPGTAY